jgi:hypothetical protein
LYDENTITAGVTLVTGGLCGFFEVTLLFIFVQQGRYWLRTACV